MQNSPAIVVPFQMLQNVRASTFEDLYRKNLYFLWIFEGFFGIVLDDFSDWRWERNIQDFVKWLHDLEGLWQFREHVWNVRR